MAWGANIPDDAKVVIVAYGDGTIRWHRLDNGQELLALFVHAKDRRWVAWTPGGYYRLSGRRGLDRLACEPRLERRGGFLLRHPLPRSILSPRHCRLVLNTLDEAKAVEQANQSSSAAGKWRILPNACRR